MTDEVSIEFIKINLHLLSNEILTDIQNRIMTEKLKKTIPHQIYGCLVCGTSYHQLMRQKHDNDDNKWTCKDCGSINDQYVECPCQEE